MKDQDIPEVCTRLSTPGSTLRRIIIIMKGDFITHTHHQATARGMKGHKGQIDLFNVTCCVTALPSEN